MRSSTSRRTRYWSFMNPSISSFDMGRRAIWAVLPAPATAAIERAGSLAGHGAMPGRCQLLALQLAQQIGARIGDVLAHRQLDGGRVVLFSHVDQHLVRRDHVA